MKMRSVFLATCAASALVIGTVLASPALAADKMVTKAPAAEPIQWWYEGFVEVGGRFYLNNPDKTKLGKFYEYRDLQPGVFGDFLVGAHRRGADPIDIEIWGKNVGWNDQAFGLDLSKPGAYYLTLGWDETPHVFAKDAKTTYSGGNILTTPTYPFPPGAATNTFVNNNSNTFDLKYRRDTASGQFRWTPTDNWDVTADYSHMHRDGAQRLSALTFAPPAGRGGADTRASIELPKPVNDTTQNGNLKAEYAGSTPWGKSFNFALGGGFSVYNNDVGCGSVAGFRPPGSSDANCLTFQNPWVAANTAVDPLFNRYSLAPDNQAQTFSVSGGVGLPFNSRYMGTFQYTRMTQDETFMTSTINPLVTPATLTRSSLGGDARTTLFNNALNTQITSDLKSTLRYRYYDYHSNQQPITITGLFTNPDTNAGAAGVLTTQPVNFNKQNAGADLAWQPLKWLNTGAAYEWERWSRQMAGTDVVTLTTGLFDVVTNENAAKIFADTNWGWSALRASLRYGERRLGSDYANPLPSNSNAFRMVDVQNRNSTIAKASWAFNMTETVTITPVGGYQFDDYQTDGTTQFGIKEYKSWNAGGDVAWNLNRMASVYVSYIHDNGHRQVYQNTVPSNLVLDTTDFIDTVIVGGKWTAIPDKLFLNATYSYTRSTSKWASNCGPGGCLFSPMPTFPDTHDTNQRFDASAKYMLDPTFLRNAGFLANAQAYVKARVLWEQNNTDSWQNIDQQLGWLVNPADLTMARSVFLGIGSPNYNVVLGMLSFGLKW
jgi:MtrB/PioB family decaheme-associated outer membrane protein